MNAIAMGMFGAIGLGALILGLAWWLRSLDRSRRRSARGAEGEAEGISAAFKRK